MDLRPLRKGIEQLGKRANTGELAFLCLNGKSENHIRDIVAFNIATAHPKWLVQRELNNVDLSIVNTRGNGLEVEFKLGYACVVASNREKSHVLRSAILDLTKRPKEIVSCIGLMHFESECVYMLEGVRNPDLVRRSILHNDSLKEAKKVVEKLWPQSRRRFVLVDCGQWKGIKVTIEFAVVWHSPHRPFARKT